VSELVVGSSGGPAHRFDTRIEVSDRSIGVVSKYGAWCVNVGASCAEGHGTKREKRPTESAARPSDRPMDNRAHKGFLILFLSVPFRVSSFSYLACNRPPITRRTALPLLLLPLLITHVFLPRRLFSPLHTFPTSPPPLHPSLSRCRCRCRCSRRRSRSPTPRTRRPRCSRSPRSTRRRRRRRRSSRCPSCFWPSPCPCPWRPQPWPSSSWARCPRKRRCPRPPSPPPGAHSSVRLGVRGGDCSSSPPCFCVTPVLFRPTHDTLQPLPHTRTSFFLS
jgi:hypothetical protein